MASYRNKIAAMRERKSLLFLKKKKQKDFYVFACGTIEAVLQAGRSGEYKSLLVLFFRKEQLS
jgi:hypothetical protein